MAKSPMQTQMLKPHKSNHGRLKSGSAVQAQAPHLDALRSRPVVGLAATAAQTPNADALSRIPVVGLAATAAQTPNADALSRIPVVGLVGKKLLAPKP